MASATVDSPSDRLQLEALPLVDLRLLSQSELYALSLSSSSDDLDLRRCDDVVIPKIDRSVFNESAGSRKQTYSRLRLAPRKPEITTIAGRTRPSSARLPTPTKSPVDDPERVENARIIGLLKELFATETHDLVPIPVEYSESVPELSNVGKKRKRGRKPKSEKPPPPPPPAGAAGDVGDVTKDILVVEDFEDRDMEVVNKNGVVVDVVALANADNPFGPELKRRTEGLETEAELLGFLWELKGQWGSRRKKRKIVEASDFGDVLPNGWKLLLCLKKKEGRSWLICRRYISPNGRQFVSCKEVSSYLLSFFELQDGSQPNSGQSDERIVLAHKMASGNCENELFSVNEKFDSISGFEGLKSGTIEHLEFSFLTTQNSNSLPEDSKVLSYDAEMDQGFDSSVWLEKEALLPKITSRHQVTTVCVWCGNEFQHEAVNSGTQTGSIGSMCPTCNAKISGQLNVL